MNTNLPVLIIGGGIVGLTLSQALQKARIPNIVFERDVSPAHSVGGWGITVHWALPAFESCLPPHLFHRLRDVQVDPEQGRHDTGRFMFLDLSNAMPRYIIPPSRRLRLHRRLLRALLMDGVPILWNKALLNFTQTSGSVLAHFEDGTTVEGALLVGADGSSSRIRRLLFAEKDPTAATLHQLPVRFMGVTVRLAPFQAQVLRDIDPLLFQGSHPQSGVFLWYSTLSTPQINGSIGRSTEEYYEGQLNMSWIARTPHDEIPTPNKERVQKMKFMAQNFEQRLRDAVWDIPDDAEVVEIKIQDWPTREWDNREGLVTLIGDAAHAMTMYRGEAFNHGITDAANLSERIVEAYVGGYDAQRLRAAVELYEAEMRERTHDAVLLSRQACLDAHDIYNLKPDSPLIAGFADLAGLGERNSTGDYCRSCSLSTGSTTLLNGDKCRHWGFPTRPCRSDALGKSQVSRRRWIVPSKMVGYVSIVGVQSVKQNCMNSHPVILVWLSRHIADPCGWESRFIGKYRTWTP
ncbi:hypothetical protein BCR34DRAFT_585086 [Clohesyomyces aquaticus]|uniref:FAD-binding domain-containing protein n=1 Tax=Clohesyomyces aquaticus TaxID=1231657 RepID=A0A1Y1ZYU4_9PLEO|nr:hypothetical protein BCR34DRAFT_585086 [Clohesyomyces aquaticus]